MLHLFSSWYRFILKCHILDDCTAYPVLWPVTAYPMLWPVTAYHALWPVTAYPVLWPVTAYPVLWPVTAYPVLSGLARLDPTQLSPLVFLTVWNYGYIITHNNT